MKMIIKRLALGLASASVLTIYGCGGASSSAVSAVVTPPGLAAATIQGTAATGAALANAVVAITNPGGNSPCVEASITTSALGSYICTLKSGETAPFFIVVTDPTGNTAPLVSIASTTPAAGSALTVNATPLTTAIVAQLASDGNPLTLVSSKTVDVVALQKVIANVVAQLANVLAAIGAPAGYDPFTTSITAATAAGTGNTADMVLDVVKVVTDPATGKLALSTVDNPTPRILATATTTGTAVARPDASVSTLSQAAQIAAQAFNACFALPTAQRVVNLTVPAPTQANGGPEVIGVDPLCQKIVANQGNAAGVKFVHNGYSAGQFFYDVFTSDSMTGAKFSVPEIMAFYAAANTASGSDEAVLNIKYIDATGNPGNLVTVARNIANTASTTRPTNWWLTGNQQPVDVTVKPLIRRVEQSNPSNANTAKISTFMTGIGFFVNAKGPGSINASNPLKFARISGPGLPVNGLVYVASTGTQTSMDLFNKTGSLTAGSQCGNVTIFNCPNLWFARTQGITGSAATTTTTNVVGLGWAQAADNVDATLVVKGAKYKVELFYGLNTTAPTFTFNKILLSDLVQATQAVNLPWNTLGPQSLKALDPAGSLTGVQTAQAMDWVQNPSAQQVLLVQAVTDTTSGGFGQSTAVPKGASSVIYSQTVPALTTTSPVGRTLLFGYRMLDTSSKTAVYTYN